MNRPPPYSEAMLDVHAEPGRGLSAAHARHGLFAGLVLPVVCAIGALAGLGTPVQAVFPVASIALGLMLLRRNDAAYLEYVLWLWLLTPELRRVVDYGIGWHPLSPIMIVPPLVSLLALVPAFRGYRRLVTGGRWIFVVALAALAYGSLAGVLLVGSGPAAAALLNWLSPVALGLYVANAGPARPDLVAALRRTAILGVVVLGTYALVQFLVLPEWDRFWMANADLNSIGQPEPLKVRVFSTLNSPGPFATVLAALMTLLIGVRGSRRGAAFGIGLVALGLSLVRGAWLGLAISVFLLVKRSGGRGLARLVAIVGLPVLVLAVVGGPVTEAVTKRFNASAEAGSRDQSFTDRIDLYSRQTGAVLTELFGNGLGAVGTATKVGNRGKLSDTGSFDSGLLEFPYTFGIVVGGTFLLTLIVVSLAVWRATRTQDDFSAACGAAVVGLVIQLVFVNISNSVSGVLLWVLLGLLLRHPSTSAIGEQVHDASAVDLPKARTRRRPAQ